MIISDNILLEKITRQHLYCDKKSKESFTNIEKRKYKLAGNRLLGHFFFHILTTTKDACKQSCTLPLYLSDWENVTPRFKLSDICYCDLTKFDRIERAILLQKMKDKNNGFPHVAKLTNSKYQKLIKVSQNLSKHPRISDETKQIIEAGISPTVDALLSKLDLK